jgi:hypothetical protein
MLAVASISAFPILAKGKGDNKVLEGKFVHMVFFWLKPETDVKEFISGTESFFKQVPEIVKYHIGTPAGTERSVVDNSYSVSLVVTFKSKADQDVYQNHPVHMKYVADNKDKWLDVKIYDSWQFE